MNKYLLLALVSMASCVLATTETPGALKIMLDDMAEYYKTNGGKYDSKYFDKLVGCMQSDNDDLLLKSQNSAWQAMQTYYSSNGTSNDFYNHTDHWGGCTEFSADKRCKVAPYMRNVSHPFAGIGGKNIQIMEPCNYVSNVAFYHSTTRICDYPDWTISKDEVQAQKRSFATLALGSAFWHGSHTYAGSTFDNNMMAVIAYLAQVSLTANMPGDSTILKQLSTTPRNHTGPQVVEGIVDMFINQPAQEWSMTLNNIDLPTDYYLTFATYLASIASLLLPFFVVNLAISNLAKVALKNKDSLEFLNTKFLPELKIATSGIHLSKEDRTDIVDKFFGMMMKQFYAFVWQEHFIPDKFLYDFNWEIAAGGAFMPYWNQISTKLSGFAETDEAVTESLNLYPGDKECKAYSPHAIWHEESANGFLELVFLANSINAILAKYISN